MYDCTISTLSTMLKSNFRWAYFMRQKLRKHFTRSKNLFTVEGEKAPQFLTGLRLLYYKIHLIGQASIATRETCPPALGKPILD